jgi:GNAT superfamily N-acetyltransferase
VDPAQCVAEEREWVRPWGKLVDVSGRAPSNVTSQSDPAVVELLADRPDLIEAIASLRWHEWGREPEPTDRDWWRDCTIREAGRDALPLTWVASDTSGALGAVGLGTFDIEERHDRSPWLLGMIVRPDRRGSGIGRLLLSHVEQWARAHGYQEVWAANEGQAVDFYRRCGWMVHEIVQRGHRPSVTVLSRRIL